MWLGSFSGFLQTTTTVPVDSITTIDVVNLVLAVFAAVVATAGLVWNFAQFQLSGPRLKVDISEGRLTPGFGGVVTGRGVWAQNDPQLGSRLVVVTIRNAGRAPATVQAVSVSFVASKVELQNQNTLGVNPSLPYRLESHEAINWVFELDTLVNMAEATATVMNLEDNVVIGVARPATSERVVSKTKLTLPH